MKRLLVLGLLAGAAAAQDDEAAAILARAEAARPTDAALAFYALDWSPTLKDAKARAAKEGRPIFFIAVTNISGPDYFFNGHC